MVSFSTGAEELEQLGSVSSRSRTTLSSCLCSRDLINCAPEIARELMFWCFLVGERVLMLGNGPCDENRTCDERCGQENLLYKLSVWAGDER